MSDADRIEMEKEVACCVEAANYCHGRAAMAWTDKSRDGWRLMAEKNETLAADRREKLAADKKTKPAKRAKTK